ncbi:nst1, partial [Symbiodinium natans]
ETSVELLTAAGTVAVVTLFTARQNRWAYEVVEPTTGAFIEWEKDAQAKMLYDHMMSQDAEEEKPADDKPDKKEQEAEKRKEEQRQRDAEAAERRRQEEAEERRKRDEAEERRKRDEADERRKRDE